MSTTQATVSTLLVPTPLRGFTGGRSSVPVEGATVGEALRSLVAQFPALEPHLFDERATLRSFVNLYVGEEDIRYLEGEATPLQPGDALSLVPSVAGG